MTDLEEDFPRVNYEESESSLKVERDAFLEILSWQLKTGRTQTICRGI